MSLPLESFPIIRTGDTDEAQSVLSRELSELRFNSVKDRDQFQFAMNGVQLGRTTVVYNQFSTEAEVNAGVIENAVIVSLSVGPAAVLELDGEHVGTDRLGIVSPRRRTTIHRAAGSGVLILRAGLEAIEERMRELTGREMDRPIVFDRSVGLDQEIGAQVRRFLSYLIEDAQGTHTILNNPLLRTSVDDMLLGAILSLPSNYSDELRGEPRVDAAPVLVRRAEQYLEAHATEPVTISDVVAECHCSRRALFYAFRQHRGYTPLQFLTEMRLRSARDALLNPTLDDTVASIALACGFSHLGRFANAYRTRYGELPSETIRRM